MIHHPPHHHHHTACRPVVAIIIVVTIPQPARPGDVVVIPADDGRGSGTPVVIAYPAPASDTPPS